jgi:pimeloyl-ACP methyl ester carboxylesterase
MPYFSAPDGTKLAYHVLGTGTPLICLPGGPMQASVYLSDLGGPDAQLIKLDLRGTGDSETPADLATYRCDRQVDDVEAIREHLGLDTVNLLGHSAGANLAVSYAARHPERVHSLILLTPSVFAVGIDQPAEVRREIVQLRAGEPWFDDAAAAFERIAAGQGTDADWDAITPFQYGRWNAAAQANFAREETQLNKAAAAIFRSEGAFDPPAIRGALASLDVPVLLIAGTFDIGASPRVVAEYARLFRNATLEALPEGGHFPWLDDPNWLGQTLSAFVARHGSR